MKKIYRNLLKIITILILILVVVGSSSVLAIKNAPGIANGVHSGKIDLSGLDKKTAKERLDKFFQEHIAGGVIILRYKNTVRKIMAADIDLSYDSRKTADEAAMIGTSGNFFKDAIDKFICSYYGKNVPLVIKYNKNKLNAILKQIDNKLYVAPTDAYCYVENNTIKIKAEKIGRKVADKKLTAAVTAKLKEENYPQIIDIPVEDIPPKISQKKLQQMNTILASYTTSFSAYATNRNKNILVAARNLSGTLVEPETVFSFNNTVGPRLIAEGYKEAPVIINGKVVPGIGGGVCQVSSTLYDAILLAGLTSVSRTAHYFPAEYVPIALDATVAYGVIDFKFRNNLHDAIYIYSHVNKSSITIFILGSSRDVNKYHIILRSFRNGNGSASAYRLYLENGTVKKREFLHTDSY
ncbi:VanW family protein [Pectinatus sottacetonis]|uniref:VanW family protein n=1 Tax=Pectinatus sottacetonis TaxID=1002795 RepID=UPI0018C7DCDF|nr:VanW family protein [Pectinatus sottacetonis]